MPRSSSIAEAMTYSATDCALAPTAAITAMPRAGTGLGVDVVEADAEPRHDPAAGQRREQVAAHLGAVADDEGIGAGGELAQARRVVDELRVVEHVVRSGQLRHAGRAHELADDDACQFAAQALS